MAISEALFFPVISFYLVLIRKIDPLVNLPASILGSGMIGSLMAAVLVIVIARIFRFGIELSEDVELKI